MDLIELLPDLSGARWSLMFCDATTGSIIADSQPNELLPTASVGKLLLLAHLAERVDEDPELAGAVRDHRSPDHPPTVSVATATELCGFMTAVHHGHLISSNASHWLRRGMSLNVDLSLIPHHLGLDPLHHPGPDAAPGVANSLPS